MRFFIALEIPEESKQELRVVQEQIKQIFPHIRLTDNNKLHLTIAFMGEHPDRLETDLIKIIQEAAWDIPPFKITPAYLDGFPSLHQAKTLWVGINGDIAKLIILRERIKDGMMELHLDVDERRYIPHIAVAKANHTKINNYLETELEKLMEKQFQPIKISSIKLFESILESGFHSHNTLAEVPLLLS